MKGSVELRLRRSQMSKPGLAFGLNLPKKSVSVKPAPVRRKGIFGGDDSDDDDSNRSDLERRDKLEHISGDLDEFESSTVSDVGIRVPKGRQDQRGILAQPPKQKSRKPPSAMFGDLSSSLAARKNADQAAEQDSSIYEYDSIYDSLKPKKEVSGEDEERRPKYMRGLMQAAEVRKRDALIAEEKKIAREREAEGDEYEGTEKFVTASYKRQQEENRRIEEEEKRREEEEARENKDRGMSAFYRSMLNRDEQRHAEAIKAAEERARRGPIAQASEEDQAAEQSEEKREAERARELKEMGISVALNEDGQVVDKRQLLKGGLNVGSKIQEEAQKETDRRPAEKARRGMSGVQLGKKQAMRERESRKLAAQLEQSLKRSRADEDEDGDAEPEDARHAAKGRRR